MSGVPCSRIHFDNMKLVWNAIQLSRSIILHKMFYGNWSQYFFPFNFNFTLGIIIYKVFFLVLIISFTMNFALTTHISNWTLVSEENKRKKEIFEQGKLGYSYGNYPIKIKLQMQQWNWSWHEDYKLDTSVWVGSWSLITSY